MSISTRATGHNIKRHIQARSGKLPPHTLQAIAEDVREGAVVILPTETVYGMGTSAFSLVGIRRIYALKGRQFRKPLALLVPSLEAARPLIESIPKEAHALAKAFWPGPLTLIFRASALGRLVTGGLATIGVRVPDHPAALAVLKAAGVPLATTSVNKTGKDPAVSGTASAHLFGAQVEWLIDSGTCRVKTASSVIDLSGFPFSIKREGAVSKKEIERILS